MRICCAQVPVWQHDKRHRHSSWRGCLAEPCLGHHQGMKLSVVNCSVPVQCVHPEKSGLVTLKRRKFSDLPKIISGCPSVLNGLWALPYTAIITEIG